MKTRGHFTSVPSANVYSTFQCYMYSLGTALEVVWFTWNSITTMMVMVHCTVCSTTLVAIMQHLQAAPSFSPHCVALSCLANFKGNHRGTDRSICCLHLFACTCVWLSLNLARIASTHARHFAERPIWGLLDRAPFVSGPNQSTGRLFAEYVQTRAPKQLCIRLRISLFLWCVEK